MTPKLATLLAQSAQYSYTLAEVDAPAGMTRATNFSDGSGFRNASLLQFDDKAVLAFQGAIVADNFVSIEDWIQDFRVGLVPAHLGLTAQGIRAVSLPGMVHEGFINQLSGNYATTIDFLRRGGGSGVTAPLYLTGHSQGAAVAVLAAAALSLAGIQVAEVAAFGSPRPADVAFAIAAMAMPSPSPRLPLPIWRWEFADDIVPHVPTASARLATFAAVAEALELPHLGLLFSDSYSSVGTLIYSDGPTSPARTVNPTAEGTLRRARMDRLPAAGLGALHDHHLVNYIAMAKRWDGT